MRDRDDLNFLGALGLLAVGALIGAAAALLLAPQTGDETRELLREKSADWARQARERGVGAGQAGAGDGGRRAGRAPRSTSGAAARSSRTPPPS